jgi:protein-S-isoprenylcysteine O-methyltransferase Ste14
MAPTKIILIPWIVFFAYWIISARAVKRNKYQQRGWWWVRIIIIAMFLLLSRLPYFRTRIVPRNATWDSLGLIVCAGGIACSIWARWHLGANWSGAPSLKQEHELVTSGPYRFVRHPIYTGLLLALLGTALVSGALWWIIFSIVCLAFVYRVRVEENLMAAEFPNEYSDYRKRTNALIPFVW